jgi:hypothetical protein
MSGSSHPSGSFIPSGEPSGSFQPSVSVGLTFVKIPRHGDHVIYATAVVNEESMVERTVEREMERMAVNQEIMDFWAEDWENIAVMMTMMMTMMMTTMMMVTMTIMVVVVVTRHVNVMKAKVERAVANRVRVERTAEAGTEGWERMVITVTMTAMTMMAMTTTTTKMAARTHQQEIRHLNRRDKRVIG